MRVSLPSEEKTDSQLVAALNGGDLSAFDLLYYRHRDWVFRLALHFTASHDDALDVLQETFAYLFRKFPGFVLSAKMTTFLYPVVRNLSIAARKKRTRERNEDEWLDPPSAPQSIGGGREELEIVLRSLPEIQREVLLLRFVDDMTLAEIGAALGIPEGTVKSRMHHAVAALKRDERLRRYFDAR
jgi:RNA polymerase sigma-70 factor, ECF subfamily